MMLLGKSSPASDQVSFKVVKRRRVTRVNDFDCKFRTTGATVARGAAQLLSPAHTDTESNADEDRRLRPRWALRLTSPSVASTSSVAFSYQGVDYDFARWPGNILRSRGPQPGFENFEDFLAQQDDDKCPPGCRCRDEDGCPCVRNKTVCDLACECQQHCPRRFVGCGCRDGCSSSCWCHCKHRQCGEWCSCTDCGNDLDPRVIPRMRVQPSTIPTAGEGLFGLSKIAYKQYLGSYDGQKTQLGTSTAEVIMDFRISNTQCVRPNRDTSLLFKINHAQPGKANVQFLTFETRSGRKVLAFAVTDIRPGTELLAWYGPECAGRAFHHIPLISPLRPFVRRPFSPVIKRNGTGYEIHPIDVWQAYAAVLSWRGFHVGQDVFVNFSTRVVPTDVPLHLSDAQFISRQLKSCWVARIVEIRVAADHKARVVVVWYDRPLGASEDRPHPFELVGLHLLDVVDGDTLSSPTKVAYIKLGEAVPKDQLYYQYVHAKDRLDPSRRSEVFLWVERTRPTRPLVKSRSPSIPSLDSHYDTMASHFEAQAATEGFRKRNLAGSPSLPTADVAAG